MDDVHSSESYIISNWTVEVNSADAIFNEIATILKNILSQSDYERLVSNDFGASDIKNWCDLIPMKRIEKYIEQLYSCLNNSLEEKTSNFYAWKNISENLSDCNLYVSNNLILIRPWIAPTETNTSYKNLKHRILMSATLGKSGELERVTGLRSIKRLPIVNDWDKRDVGRRFFIMPDLSLGEKNNP